MTLNTVEGWSAVSNPGNDYDWDAGYMRNTNNSTTMTISESVESFEMTDFDVSVRLKNHSSNGSKSDVLLQGFYDYNESATRSGPWFYINMGTYHTGITWDYFGLRIYDADDVLQKEVKLNTWDYSATLGTWYWGRILKTGNIYSFKHWREGDGEPEEWDSVDDLGDLGTFTGPLYARSRTANDCGFDDFSLLTVEAEPYGWYAADAIVANDGDPVNTWTDAGSGEKDLIPFTSPGTPPVYKTDIQNGLPGVLFSGFQQSLYNATADLGDTPTTWFIVYKMLALSGDHRLLAGRTGGQHILWMNDVDDPSPPHKWTTWAGATRHITTHPPDTNIHLLTWTINGANESMRFDGVEVDSQDYGQEAMDSGFTIMADLNSAGKYCNGYMFELQSYSGGLADVTENETSLMIKWGIGIYAPAPEVLPPAVYPVGIYFNSTAILMSSTIVHDQIALVPDSKMYFFDEGVGYAQVSTYDDISTTLYDSDPNPLGITDPVWTGGGNAQGMAVDANENLYFNTDLFGSRTVYRMVGVSDTVDSSIGFPAPYDVYALPNRYFCIDLVYVDKGSISDKICYFIGAGNWSPAYLGYRGYWVEVDPMTTNKTYDLQLEFSWFNAINTTPRFAGYDENEDWIVGLVSAWNSVGGTRTRIVRWDRATGNSIGTITSTPTPYNYGSRGWIDSTNQWLYLYCNTDNTLRWYDYTQVTTTGGLAAVGSLPGFLDEQEGNFGVAYSFSEVVAEPEEPEPPGPSEDPLDYLYDPFDTDDGWSLDETPSNPAVITGGQIVMTTSNAERACGAMHILTISGDFDVQVDWDYATPPAATGGVAQDYGGLMVRYVGNGNYREDMLMRSYNTQYEMHYVINGSFNYVRSSTGIGHTSGKFRIHRVGVVWESQYWNGSGWTTLGGSRSVGAGDVECRFRMTSAAANYPTATITMDNFTIVSYGGVSFT